MQSATDSRTRTAERPLQTLLDALASDAIAPGAGAAAAVALALAAGCLGKAIAISVKRGSPDARLLHAEQQLRVIRTRALRGADEDAQRFEEFTKNANAETSSRLIQTGLQLQGVGDKLLRIISDVESLIDPIVAADVLAARALCEAFRTIETQNLRENAQSAEQAT